MSEDFVKIHGTKEEQYQQLTPQIQALLLGEEDMIANMANLAAILKQQFAWLWVGFYMVKNDVLVLGPFQGPIACTRIQYGRGVCGTAWSTSKTIMVDNVEKFPGHIACSSLSKSEIVVPFYADGQVIGVLDVDSEYVAHFDEIDQRYLEQIVKLLIKKE